MCVWYQVCCRGNRSKPQHACWSAHGPRAVWRSGPAQVAIWCLVKWRDTGQHDGGGRSAWVSHSAHYQPPIKHTSCYFSAARVTYKADRWVCDYLTLLQQEGSYHQGNTGMSEWRLRGGAGLRPRETRFPQQTCHWDLLHRALAQTQGTNTSSSHQSSLRTQGSQFLYDVFFLEENRINLLK